MRLTYRDSTVPHTNAKGELWEAYSDENYNEVINKLAAYEDTGFEPEEVAQMGNALKLQSVMVNEASHYWSLQQQGRLVILPCKVGDTFYYIAGTLRGNKYVASDTVVAIEISDTEPWIIDSCGCHHIEFWVTRAEAESALKGESDDV